MINIPGYKVNSQIYQGSNTAIYKAKKQGSNTPVIIKVLNKKYPTPKQIEKFKNQYQIAQSLQSPGHASGNYRGMNMINLHQWRTGEYGNGIKEEESFTLDSGSGRDYVIPYHTRIRRLTPIECERLQSFPDNWTEGVSDTQRYKQMGNAVTVNVVEAIAKRLK